MKLSSLFTGLALVSLVTVGDIALGQFNQQSNQASAQEMQGLTSIPTQQKISLITKHKGELGGGDELPSSFLGI